MHACSGMVACHVDGNAATKPMQPQSAASMQGIARHVVTNGHLRCYLGCWEQGYLRMTPRCAVCCLVWCWVLGGIVQKWVTTSGE